MKTAFQLLGVSSAAVSSPSELLMPHGAFLSAATKCGCLQAGGYVLSLVQMGTPGAWVALRCVLSCGLIPDGWSVLGVQKAEAGLLCGQSAALGFRPALQKTTNSWNHCGGKTKTRCCFPHFIKLLIGLLTEAYPSCCAMSLLLLRKTAS